MRTLSPKAHISFGLVGLMVSTVLLAAMFDLIPDRAGAVREGRAALAEVLAAGASTWVEGADLRRAEETLKFAVDRNDDLLSASMGKADGRAVVSAGPHAGWWQPMEGEYSTDTQIRVPVLAAEKKWGELELRFRPLLGEGIFAFLRHPLVVLIAFIAVSGYFAFYFYMSKALAVLDPSKAIPSRVRSALDTMAEGLLVIDRHGRIVLANRTFAALVAKDADALIGTEPADLNFETSDETDDGAIRFPWIRALETGTEEYGVPMYLHDHLGVRRALMVNCSPVLASSGKPGGVLVSFDDVTELEARGELVREARDEAEAANRAKSEFLANMSHEIRTPMNAILGFTEVLKRGYAKSESDWRKHLNTIHSSGKHLLHLINDVLDLSKVEAGRLDVESIPLTPHVLIRDVVKVLAVKADEKGISLDFEVSGSVPETILSDPTRLRQIVTNLVGNAIKFTDQGGVKLVLRLESSNEASQLVIDIIDSGIGMPADKLETIFEAFAQADSSVARQFGGTGLGLAISRRFARALGGDIVVRSEIGTGSVFTVSIAPGPLNGVKLLSAAEALVDEEVASTAIKECWRFSSGRVLVVDDGEENRELVKIVLGEAGLHVEDAENGQVGVDKAMAQAFDVILMDMQMPVMDGRTATIFLREQGLQTPIIAMTANAMKGFENESLEVGCTGYLTKPVDVDLLIETLADLLGGERVETDEPEDLRGSPLTPQVMSSDSPAVSPVVSSLADSDTRFHAIIQRFVVRLEEQLGEIERAWGSRDFDQLASLAHWLKGSAGTVGFDAFTEPAQTLEALSKERNEGGIDAVIRELRRLAHAIVVPGAEEGAEHVPAPNTVRPG